MFSTSKTQALRACKKLQAKIDAGNSDNNTLIKGIGVGITKDEGDYAVFVYIGTKTITPEISVWLKQFPPKIDGVKVNISLIGDVVPIAKKKLPND